MPARRKSNGLTSTLALTATLFGAGCQTLPEYGPIRTEQAVDLDRFMGDWYVIASIPTIIEKKAYNAIETYRRGDGNRIETTFSFNKGSFDGPRKVYKPTGFVSEDASNAIWRMRFIWPIKADYRIVHVDRDYQLTIIGRSKRDYVWIMARTPQITNERYFELVRIVREQGYDTDKLRRVPQQWPPAAQ